MNMKDINYWDSVDSISQEDQDFGKVRLRRESNQKLINIIANITALQPGYGLSMQPLLIESERVWKRYYKAQIDHKEGTPKTWSDFHEHYFRMFGHHTKEILKLHATINNCDHKAWGLE
jgi:hypothetical protein